MLLFFQSNHKLLHRSGKERPVPFFNRPAHACALCPALAITGAAILGMVGVIGVRLVQVLSVSVLLALVLILRFGALPGRAE